MPIRCRFPATQRPRGPGFQTCRIADFQVGCTAHRLAGLEAPKPVPCGMNCSLCRAFLRRRNKCPGCRGDDRGKCKTRVACKIKNCEARRGSFCTYCASFPCERLIPRDAAQLTVAGFRPRPMGGGRTGAGGGDFSSPAPQRGGPGMPNGTGPWRAAGRSTASLGNGWEILNAGFGAVRSGIIFTPESKTPQAPVLFQRNP
jgi:hypothetical protein